MASRLRKGEISQRILKAVLKASETEGLNLGNGLSRAKSPVLRDFAQWYNAEPRQGRYRIRKNFESMRKKGLLEIRNDSSGNRKIFITSKGLDTIRAKDIAGLELEKNEDWDGTWRMITFDIPEKMKGARNAFRQKLKALGFLPVRKSVWAHYLDCEKETQIIIRHFSLVPYVTMMKVESFDGDEVIRKKFGSD